MEYTRAEIYKGLLLHAAANPGFAEKYAIGNICDRSGWTKAKLNEEFGQLSEMQSAKNMTEDRCWEIYSASKKSAPSAA